MKTKVVIELNKKDFHIEVDELSPNQKKEFGEKFNVEKAKWTAYDEALTRFNDVNDQYLINKELLVNAQISITEKVKMLWEQKDLLLQLRPLRVDMEVKAKVPVNFDGLAKEQFELAISGEDKESLVKEMEASGKSYRDMLNEILPKVAEEKEKK